MTCLQLIEQHHFISAVCCTNGNPPGLLTWHELVQAFVLTIVNTDFHSSLFFSLSSFYAHWFSPTSLNFLNIVVLGVIARHPLWDYDLLYLHCNIALHIEPIIHDTISYGTITYYCKWHCKSEITSQPPTSHHNTLIHYYHISLHCTVVY